jgi:putative hydrolase of the HAD superfamily
MDRVVLFDADGVLTVPEEMFSIIYSRSRGLSFEPFETFFQTEWADYVTGRRDLKEQIRENPDMWQWAGTPEELLEYWFKTEDIRNDEMISLVQEVREKGTPCFLATEQEHYRGEYMKNVMFKDLFDGYFVTADIGVKKSDPAFFGEIVKRLNEEGMNVRSGDVIFFDDSQSKVDAALQAGIDACLFEGIASVKRKLIMERLM